MEAKTATEDEETISQAVLRQFGLLPKRGKPTQRQWYASPSRHNSPPPLNPDGCKRTVLAGVVMRGHSAVGGDGHGDAVVALGTGTFSNPPCKALPFVCDRADACVVLVPGNKCSSPSKMSDQGDVINDTHAEIIARRAFVRCTFLCLTSSSRAKLCANHPITGSCGTSCASTWRGTRPYSKGPPPPPP